MTHSAIKNKSFSFNSDGSLNQFGLKSIIQEISPKLLRPAVKYTLMIASEHATASDKLCIFKSLQNIADECGISRDTARRHLQKLTEMGILRKEFVIDKETRKQKPCLYTYSPLFIRIAKGFRRYADKLKSRRQLDFKSARTRFNTLLERLVFRAKSGFTSLKNKIFSNGYPPKSAIKQGWQNTTQGGGKTDHNKVVINKINKYSAGDTIEGNAAGTVEKSAMIHRNGKVRFMQDIRDLFTAMSQRKSSRKETNINKSTLEQKKTEKYKKRTDNTASNTMQEAFNHARYEEANRQADQDWEERARIARQSSPQKISEHLANLRALLNNAQAKKAGK
ncbi:helix-turn-helix domain-containing protein [Salmonella enterica]|uniref:Winged helix-turn-helix transcriptional regulator n=1 Tax=Salmonella diarizonae TaxID=59204 RepID=A0A6Y1QXE8_SALDZ|nr:transcriptional regulator [Salmonella enterica subsp. enterica serovar Weltevreden]ECJ5923831.1 winged helix-turn-helix transcriptional regulator [Salmonella enterica subsp. houtenae]EDW0107099.1 winged helix-turn-helix transcriptional regulator [Salmonella enterica subsp. salamae serovar 6,7:z:1,5]EEE1294333.1 winged helix-turn-helix transcriptional regulator [Salmonella enterica subsp. diarizonae]EHM5264971.1 helix-turn-helix domain-containing protein [Salmonella enterica]